MVFHICVFVCVNIHTYIQRYINAYSYSVSPIQQIKALRTSRNKDDFEVNTSPYSEEKNYMQREYL